MRQVTALDSAEATSVARRRRDAPSTTPLVPTRRAESEVDAQPSGCRTRRSSHRSRRPRSSGPTRRRSVVPEAQWADDTERVTALTWVDPVQVAAHPSHRHARSGGRGCGRHRPHARGETAPCDRPAPCAGAARRARRTRRRLRGHDAPVAAARGPTDRRGRRVRPDPAAAAALTWPAQGSAAVGIAGMGTAASAAGRRGIASVTKVVIELMVLDRMPLARRRAGTRVLVHPRRTTSTTGTYRRSDQSALDVPVGGMLTEYQMLQGTLLGSANNYIDRLSR